MSSPATQNLPTFLSFAFEAQTLRVVLRDELSSAQQIELRIAMEKAVRRIVRTNSGAHRPSPFFRSAWTRVLGYSSNRLEDMTRSLNLDNGPGSKELIEDLSGLVGFLRDELHQDYLRAVHMVDELDRVAHKHGLYRMPIEPLPPPAEVVDLEQIKDAASS